MPTTAPETALTESPAQLIDHTLLKPQATGVQIETLCEEAVEWGFASVCVPPVFAPRAVDLLYGSEVAAGTVVGFPCGYETTAAKVQQTSELVNLGCTEIDMVIQVGWALAGKLDQVEEEIRQVIAAAADARVKVILECCELSDPLKIELARIVARSGAAYVKTSTGFGAGGATLEDVRLLAQAVDGRIGVKAAGGIRSLEQCAGMKCAGATRIGTSAGVEIMRQWLARQEG